jgi:hypothetical protein
MDRNKTFDALRQARAPMASAKQGFRSDPDAPCAGRASNETGWACVRHRCPAWVKLSGQIVFRVVPARNLVERFFNKIKRCRRVAIRYDKLATIYLAFIKLASIRIWLRAGESTPRILRFRMVRGLFSLLCMGLFSQFRFAQPWNRVPSGTNASARLCHARAVSERRMT